MPRGNPPPRRPQTLAERTADRLLDSRGNVDDVLRVLTQADDLEPHETVIIRRARRWWERDGVPVMRVVQQIAERRVKRQSPQARAA